MASLTESYDASDAVSLRPAGSTDSRRRMAGRRFELAPWADVEPISSWSKQVTSRMVWSSSSAAESRSDVMRPMMEHGLRVVEHELEIHNVGDVDLGVRGDDVDNVRVVALRQVPEGLEVLFRLFIALHLCLRSALVQLCRRQAGNGEQLDLLVGVEARAPVKVDSQCRDTQEGLVDFDELLGEGAGGILDKHPASNAEIAA
ncbi:hypothetical protein HYQ46_000532 [Verticillium longisporum]|nr:hypothetical protein HYQ46_000532 [Verticillium longisporum]